MVGPMKISFDLDDTLVCNLPSELQEKNRVPWFLRSWLRDPLRRGAVDLLGRLQSLGHEVAIYTTSGRSPRSVRWWLWCYGIRVSQVINRRIHEQAVRQIPLRNIPTKLPSLFNIDLHIDDLPGVAIEGRRHHFEVLVVDPHDTQWTTRVLDAVETG